MRLEIQDGGNNLSIECRWEKYEVRDIQSFFEFYVLGCSNIAKSD